MARRRSRLLWIAVALLATFVTFLGSMRILRHRTSPPEQLGRVQRERNLFTAAGVILFDAGVDPAGGALDRLLGALGATRANVHDVFLTRGHFDHVAAAPLCVQARIRVGADALSGAAVETVCTGHQGCTPAGKGAAMLKALLERAKSGGK